ncbi:MAG TPA: shikimate kinase AroK [Burkholderiales bacterium]|nr:shikimate kinase AroK [Burkholderiales bacterium]
MDDRFDNIFLVGLMGSGKTTVGKLLSRQLRRPFYDSDHEIVRRTGVTIPMIFEVEGESGFRKREEQMLLQLTEQEGIVLATGGGAVLSPVNRTRLKSRGTVIYLRGTIDELWQRTRHDRNRPLLQTQDPKGRLRDLYAERDPLYREIADIVVDTGRQNVHALVSHLVQGITAKARHSG